MNRTAAHKVLVFPVFPVTLIDKSLQGVSIMPYPITISINAVLSTEREDGGGLH